MAARRQCGDCTITPHYPPTRLPAYPSLSPTRSPVADNGCLVASSAASWLTAGMLAKVGSPFGHASTRLSELDGYPGSNQIAKNDVAYCATKHAQLAETPYSPSAVAIFVMHPSVETSNELNLFNIKMLNRFNPMSLHESRLATFAGFIDRSFVHSRTEVG